MAALKVSRGLHIVTSLEIRDSLNPIVGELIFDDVTDASVSTPPTNQRALYFSSNSTAIVVKDSAGVIHNLEVGGVSFPIEPDITDNGSTWTGTQTLNLATGDGHIYKWIIDQNLLFAATVTNIPTSGTQRTFELEFEHDGVGGTFTVTLPNNFTDESGNTLVSFTIANGDTNILTARVNDGTNFLVVQKNFSGTAAASGMTVEMDNMGTTAMNAHLLPSATALRNLGSTTLFMSNLYTGTLNIGDATDIQTITGLPTGIQYTVKTGDAHIFRINVTNEVEIDATALYPTATAVTNLGKSTLYWSNIYTGTLNLGDVTDNQTLTGTPTGITYNVKAGDSHDLAISSTVTLKIASLLVTVTGNLVPNATAVRDLGSNALFWGAVYLGAIRFNASTQFINMQGAIMHYEVPTGGSFDWEIANTPEFTVSNTAIDFHSNIVNNASTINFTDGNAFASTPVEMNLTFPAAADHFTWDWVSNERYEWGEGTAHFKSPDGATIAFDWLYERIDSAPNDGDIIMQIDYQGEDSAGNPTDYVREIFTAVDTTTASEAGGWKIQVATGTGGLGGGIEVRGDANITSNVGISFFGSVPVPKQNITGARSDSSSSGALANLLLALSLFGLVLDSST